MARLYMGEKYIIYFLYYLTSADIVEVMAPKENKTT